MNIASLARRLLGGLHTARLLYWRAHLPWSRHKPFVLWQDKTYSYAEVYHEASRYARLFRTRRQAAVDAGELAPGAPLHIGLYLDNGPEFLFAAFGAALEGDLIFGLNTGFRGDTLAAVLERGEIRLLLVDQNKLEFIEQILDQPGAPRREQILVHGESAPDDMQRLSEALQQPNASGRRGRARGADPMLVIYTSGTTGVPKAIPCSHLKLMAAGILMRVRVGTRASDRGYVCMPLFHSNAWLLGIMPMLAAGGSFVLTPRFSASAFEGDILRHGVTYMNYVGQPLHYILKALEDKYPDARSIESALADHPDNLFRMAIGNGASAVDRQKLIRYLGMAHIFEVYGSTEAVISTILMPGDPPDSVGRPSSKVLILDENDHECPPAEVDAQGRVLNYEQAVGEISARVPRDNLLFDGYYGDPTTTERKYRGGFYRSGDLGHIRIINGKRYLYFDGRTDDWIRKDGENFSAETVAHFASQHPGVELAAAYGVPDPVADERVAIALQLEPGVTFDPERSFARFIQQQQGGGMDPRWMPDFIRIVDQLPLSPTHKVLVREVKREHFNLEAHPEMQIWFRQRGDQSYRRLTPEAYQQLRQEFEANGRAHLL